MDNLDPGRMFIDWCPRPERVILIPQNQRFARTFNIPIPESTFDRYHHEPTIPGRVTTFAVDFTRYRYNHSTDSRWYVDRCYAWEPMSRTVVTTHEAEPPCSF